MLKERLNKYIIVELILYPDSVMFLTVNNRK